MACPTCKSLILWGGTRSESGVRYCSDKCCLAGRQKEIAKQIPAEDLDRHTLDVHTGACPRCGGEGPVDVTTADRMWSAIWVSAHSTETLVSCRPCGRGRQLRATLFCATLGWWSLEGLLFTPIIIVRNLWGAARGSSKTGPSKDLRRMVSLQLAADYESWKSQRGSVDEDPWPVRRQREN